ncbi:hypothetical protein [Botrimarina sp.]|uniref:hypothetical protein n=1 Tax=Botrimarina sp. TaxID=2795802 RepID=UPI0032ED1F41
MRNTCAALVLRCSSSLAIAALAASVSVGQTILFEDAFDSEVVGTPAAGQFAPGPVGTTGWSFLLDQPNQGDVRYGYDYSLIGIPEAPNTAPGDTATTGVALRTNVSAGAPDTAEIRYEDPSFTGRYQVQVDMFLSWAADESQIGTTEHGGLFIGKAFPGTETLNFPSAEGAGMIISTDGDTTNFDYALRKNQIYPTIQSGQYAVTEFGFGTQLGWDNTDVNTDPANGDLIDLPALFPEKTLDGGVTQSAGAAGYRWLTLVADVDTNAIGNGAGTVPGTTTFSIEIAESGERFTLGTIDNSVIEDLPDGPVNNWLDSSATEQVPVDMSGRVTLKIIDFFSSVASDINLATVVFDNLIVTELPTGLPGDYNDDGFVDAADYTVWRDGDSPDSSQAGYDLWADNYGSSASAAAGVPEPTAAVLLAIGSLWLAPRRRAA